MYTEIKTVEDAFKDRGLDYEKHKQIAQFLPERLAKYVVNHFERVIVTEAINGGWEPNYEPGTSELKYELWVYPQADSDRPSGFGVSLTTNGGWRTFTHCGSRLCFQSYAKLDHFRTHFKDMIVEDMVFLKK